MYDCIPQVRTISVTPLGEELMEYCARVSNPDNQDARPNPGKLLKYCIKHGHWSVFEMADLTLEIVTYRIIGEQILRHKSFSFQVFSQRYADIHRLIHNDLGNMAPVPRPQSTKNRQGSEGEFSAAIREELSTKAKAHMITSLELYNEMLCNGAALEYARFILPTCIPSRMYMKGSVRSWLHYLQVRLDSHTQLEHREVAELAKKELERHFPTTCQAFFGDSND